MFEDVSLSGATFKSSNVKFEVGHIPVPQAIGLAVSIHNLSRSIDVHRGEDPILPHSVSKLHPHLADLSNYLYEQLGNRERIHICAYQTSVVKRVPICSFNVDGMAPSTICAALRERGENVIFSLSRFFSSSCLVKDTSQGCFLEHVVE